MSKFIQVTRLLPAALLALSAACAPALAQSGADTGKVRISLQAPYQVSAQEAMSMERPYALSNGQVLVVRQQDQQFFGRLAQPRELRARQEVRLHATAPGRFVTERGASLAFEQDGERVVIDDAQRLPGLRTPAGQRLADTAGTDAPIRLVSR